METSKIVLIVFILTFVVACFVRWAVQSYRVRKMAALYETVSLGDRAEIFAENKEEFYFVGKILHQTFPKESAETSLAEYIEMYRMYISLKGDVHKVFDYEKNNAEEFDEEKFYSMLALVMLNADGLKNYDDDSAERIEPFKKKAKAKIKTVETILNDESVLDMNLEKRLGDRHHAILVSGVSGIETYLDSIVTEDDTELKYIHAGTLYIRDKENGIDYDLRKYSLRDVTTDVEMCNLWFNPYGHEDCKECIEGYMFKNDKKDECASVVPENALEAPSGVKLVNIPSSGRPKLSWEGVEGADKYFIYRARGKAEPYVYLAASVSTKYIDLNAEVGKRYFYAIKAADTTKKYAHSELSGHLGSVCDLARPVVTASTDVETGKVKLTWDAVEDAVTYEIHRATSPEGEYKKMYTHRKTEYVNTGLVEPGVTYYYKVRAIHSNSYANSAFSEIVSGCWNPNDEANVKEETDIL